MSVNEKVALTTDDLKTLIATAVASAISESKKPTELEAMEIVERKRKLEAQNKQVAQDQETRREMALQQLNIQKNRITSQQICTHKHRKGETHCVYVADDLGGFILCQKCIAVIRPGVAPADYRGTAIYDHDLYNRLFQDCGSNGFWE